MQKVELSKPTDTNKIVSETIAVELNVFTDVTEFEGKTEWVKVEE